MPALPQTGKTTKTSPSRIGTGAPQTGPSPRVHGMSKEEDKRFIETPEFPIREVNEASAREKQGGARPPHWEMVFWWTRKPLASARAVIAGSLLPAGTSPWEFKRYLRLDEKVPHRKNPNIPPSWRERFERAKLLDPFAGFGSIPLEGARLGLGEVVAVELLPTAYVFLKAVLEYPKWAVENRVAKQLVRDVERWGKNVLCLLTIYVASGTYVLLWDALSDIGKILEKGVINYR